QESGKARSCWGLSCRRVRASWGEGCNAAGPPGQVSSAGPCPSGQGIGGLTLGCSTVTTCPGLLFGQGISLSCPGAALEFVTPVPQPPNHGDGHFTYPQLNSSVVVDLGVQALCRVYMPTCERSFYPCLLHPMCLNLLCCQR
ncbi:hypothetical protein H1C71_039046, partial [Ictidomys tridecemlineatus]